MTELQKELMQEFYNVTATKVVFNKTDREGLWRKTKSRSRNLDFDLIKSLCPALFHQINKSYESGNNIQSAVFSECAYAQTLANMLNFNLFVNCSEEENFIPEHIVPLLDEHHLKPRYIYSAADKSRMLVQAGGCDGSDCALINVKNSAVYTIEFKEPGAKAGEHDLPKYGEDGILTADADWLERFSQFKPMLDKQKGLNFFESTGHNINNFSEKSVVFAALKNFSSQKYADVICTEDIRGDLVIIPADQIYLWADISGEIRPAGRNHRKVWTPDALKKILLQKGATVYANTVKIDKRNLKERRARGGNRISGYKINPLFFVRTGDCADNNGILTFDINNVRQLIPTVSVHVFFKELLHQNVKEHYNL